MHESKPAIAFISAGVQKRIKDPRVNVANNILSHILLSHSCTLHSTYKWLWCSLYSLLW